jgi:hypothetical protein
MHWAVDSRGRIPPRAEGDLVADAPSPRPLAHAAIDGRARFFRFRHSLGLRGGSRAGGVGGERGRAVRKSNERMPRASHVSRDVEVTFAGSESARSRPRRGRFEPPRGPKRAGGTLSGRARDRRGRKPRVRPSLRAETRARREGGHARHRRRRSRRSRADCCFPGARPCLRRARPCSARRVPMRRARVRVSGESGCARPRLRARVWLSREPRGARGRNAPRPMRREKRNKKAHETDDRGVRGSARDEQTPKARSARPDARDRAFCGQKTRRERANCATAERDWSREDGQNSHPCVQKKHTKTRQTQKQTVVS